MSTQFIVTMILLTLVVLLIICTIFASKSLRPIKKSVSWLISTLTMPLISNIIIMNSHTEEISNFIYHFYYISTDIVMWALLNFTNNYCQRARFEQTTVSQKRRGKPIALYALLVADMIQLGCNLAFGHAFYLEEITIDDEIYFDAIQTLGGHIHMGIHYLVFISCILIFIMAITKTAKVYKEKYITIFASILGVGIWQTIHILINEAINTSMIGYGLFGLVIFYFAVIYRPMRLLDHMLSNIASNMDVAMILYDTNNQCIWINKQSRILLALQNTELEKVNERLFNKFGDLTFNNDEKGDVINCETYDRYYILTRQTTYDEKYKITGYILSIKDDTATRKLIKQESYNANHDELTGLYNKSHLCHRIEETIKNNPDTDYIIAFTNIKNFKLVNDIFGSKFGDKVIMNFANFIREAASKNCVFGRLTGDNFGALIPKNEFDPQKLEEIMSEYIINADTHEYRLLVHTGIYEVTERNLSAAIMLDRAKLALSSISDQYNIHVAYYDDTLRNAAIYNQQITTDLDIALAEEQIRPYLQPIINSNNQVVGAEALVRWIHPEKGFMPPINFIPVFEHNGMIVKIDCYIWRKACEILSKWDNDMFISINISPRDFYYIDVVSHIKRLVKEFKIDPKRLRIEIVESVMISDSEERMRDLGRLRRAGFIVEMDDFGSGYSSLNLLKNMPVDVLKIDMMFLSKSDNNNRAGIIVKNIINLANELDITTLTEGVENEEQYKFLSDIGCDLFQGYYFDKPLPVLDFEKKYLGEVKS